MNNKLPLSWSELKKVEGFYINKWCATKNLDGYATNTKNKNVIPTKNEAEAILQLIQLMQLRDAWNGEPLEAWADWTFQANKKYGISLLYDQIMVHDATSLRTVLTFKTNELAEEFAKTFKKEILISKYVL